MIDLLHRIRELQIASCTCLTKTDEHTYHEVNCCYRKLKEVEIELEYLLHRMCEAEKDVKRLDWFQDNIADHKPGGYDGLPYGRFDIVWKSETNDIRKAIDAAMAKEQK